MANQNRPIPQTYDAFVTQLENDIQNGRFAPAGPTAHAGEISAADIKRAFQSYGVEHQAYQQQLQEGLRSHIREGHSAFGQIESPHVSRQRNREAANELRPEPGNSGGVSGLDQHPHTRLTEYADGLNNELDIRDNDNVADMAYNEIANDYNNRPENRPSNRPGVQFAYDMAIKAAPKPSIQPAPSSAPKPEEKPQYQPTIKPKGPGTL